MFLLCLDWTFVTDWLMCTSVVERHRFDADLNPDRLSILMPIRIRIRILPQVLQIFHG
jgi:hypothetical protein